ncbi:COG4315 family predicted lipoprotein [Bauldia litoralis]|uniref:COG4315 family predicted lipoprotein n=1 Tax=Bauldia litoralis TaxID=665467 RepID=UPI00326536BF
MKALIFGVAAAVIAVVPAIAMEPAKTMETSLGAVFADANGMTLYTFDKDKPGESNCYGDCATNWPPLMADEGAMAEGEWSLVERTDGTTMWAYDGMPVYTWINDAKPGDVTGDGVGGVWHVAKPGAM